MLPIPLTSTKYIISFIPFVQKYLICVLQFFLRGTQLQQLSEEYDACLANIQQTAKVLHQKFEAIPDLENAYKEVKVRFEEANKARELKQKITDLKNELAWSYVAEKEAVRLFIYSYE